MKIEELNPEDKPVINLIGGVATKNAFHVFDTATNEQLITTLNKVREMEGATAWWMGDIGLAIQERKRADLAGRAIELRDKAANLDGSVPDQADHKNRLLEEAEGLENGAEVSYRDEICRSLEIDPGYLANCVRLARFYPPSSRGEGLKPKHFRVVQDYIKQDREEAKQWLDRARENNWKASDLRKEIAKSKATAHPPETPPEKNEFEEITKADRWAMRFKETADDLTSGQAHAVLVMMSEILSLAKKLESIAKGMS